MSDVEQFRRELKARIAAAANAPRWESADFQRYMDALGPRRELFDNTARSLIVDVVKPRLDAVAGLFQSARTTTDEQGTRYTCWFAHSNRFPVTAKLEFAIEHDQSVEHLFVRCEAVFMPVFLQFQPHDKLTVTMENIEQGRVASWVERRITEFLESYLHHDRGTADLEEDIITDPICGMRLSRSDAKERADYRGHAYFFCSAECRAKFESKPERFVKFRTM